MDKNMMNSFDIETLSLETIMFQSGYLTIKQVKERRNRFIYSLAFPNLEVKMSFLDSLLDRLITTTKKIPVSDKLYNIFENGTIENMEPIIKQLFASIAYNNFTNNEIQNYEGFYASVLYAYFAALGLDIIAEDVTNIGRIDITIKFNDRIFIFEFKVNNEDPLKQIKEKKYFEKYSNRKNVEIYLIGIVFDKIERNVSNFKWEKM